MLCVVSLSTCTSPLPCTDHLCQLLGQRQSPMSLLQVYLPSQLLCDFLPTPCSPSLQQGPGVGVRLGSGCTRRGNLRSPHLALGSWTPLGLGCTGRIAVLLLRSLVNKAAALHVAFHALRSPSREHRHHTISQSRLLASRKC